jgi:hypothetical protein
MFQTHTHLYGQRVECGDSRWVLEMSHVGLEDLEDAKVLSCSWIRYEGRRELVEDGRLAVCEEDIRKRGHPH